jgi:hypothetical protein
MRANPNDRLERQYEDLTAKQKAVIDAHAENPEATNREKANVASQLLKERVQSGEVSLSDLNDDSIEGITVNESYSSGILNKDYPEVAQYREEIVQNERQEGDMQTVGDPFEGIPQEEDSYQSIQERPVKGTQAQEDSSGTSTNQVKEPTDSPLTPQQIAVSVEGDGVLVKFDRTYFKNLLETQELPPHLHKQLVNEIWDAM